MSFVAHEFAFAPLAAPAGVPDAPTAEAGAADVLAQAEAEAQALREAARAEGYEDGRAEVRAALAPALQALECAVESLQADAQERADRLEGRAVELALFLAERVLGAAIAVQPELVVEAVRGALRGIVERERITVLVHPDDLELVRGAVGDVVGALGGVEHCEVQAERRVARGGAVVRTSDGDVDARIETKLQRAREVVEAALDDGA